MAATIVSSSSSPAASASSLTFSYTTTTETVLAVMAGSGDGSLTNRSCSGVTYNAVPMTSKGVSDNADFVRIEAFVLDVTGVTPGAHNVVVTYPSAIGSIGAGATGIAGADPATFGTVATNSSTTDQLPTVVVSSASGEIVIAGVATDANASITEGGTLCWEQETISGDCCFGAESYPGAATVTATWTGSTPDNGWAAIGLSFKPSGGSPTLLDEEPGRKMSFDEDWLVTAFR